MEVLAVTPKYMVEADGRTLWINGLEDGLLGRFSKRGIDVHAKGICLDCKTGSTSFEEFAQLMQEHHGIDVIPYRSSLTWLNEVN